MSFYDQIRYEEEGEARFCVQAAMWFGVFACLTVLSSLITGGLYLWKGRYPWLLLPLARLPLVYLTYRSGFGQRNRVDYYKCRTGLSVLLFFLP